jgi:uncharacterized protein (TIGR03437 family)
MQQRPVRRRHARRSNAPRTRDTIPWRNHPGEAGETVIIYGNGFGPTSTPVISGDISRSGTLAPLPVIKIGGVAATVQFAGLNIGPGDFQFNIVVSPR